MMGDKHLIQCGARPTIRDEADAFMAIFGFHREKTMEETTQEKLARLDEMQRGMAIASRILDNANARDVAELTGLPEEDAEELLQNFRFAEMYS